MGLILANNLASSQRKRQAQRMIVDSSLDVDAIAVECSWRTLVFVTLGLGVSPTDTSLHSLGGDKNAINEQNSQFTALHSENGQRLIDIRWHEGSPSLELTEHCSTWSIRRSLAHFLHLVVNANGRQEVLHLVPVTAGADQTPTARICDCKNTVSDPIRFSTLKNIHSALTWTLYFEEVLHQIPSEKIPIPQSLLLMQFEILEDLRQMPVETLHSYASRVFPSNTTLITEVVSALASTWNSSEHQNLLSRVSSNTHQIHVVKPQPVERHESLQHLKPRSNEPDYDAEKATRSKGLTGSLFSEKCSLKDDGLAESDFFPTLISSPTFETLSSVYSSPNLVIAARCNQAGHCLDIEDPSKPEGFLARLIIALSTMRRWTVPEGWVTSIASWKVRYKIGPEAGEDKVRKLLEYEEGMFRFE